MGIFDAIGKKVEARQQGIKVSDLLALPRTHRTLMNRIIREKEITLEQAVEFLQETPETVSEILGSLVENGYLKCVERQGESVYTVYYGRTNPKDIPGSLWAALGEKLED